MRATAVPIAGTCAPEFARVGAAFERNFTDHGEIGAAVAVWVEGELVVNLWGGHADADRTRPWRHNTLASVFSGSKGLTSSCVHLLADRGEIDLHAPVARYWPEFGQAGKQDITLAMVLGHRSGVIGPREPMGWREVTDWDAVCARIAAAEPWWPPDTAQGYHVVTFGFILGEVVRRVTGRTLGHYLRTEIAEPMGIDVHIGLPATEHHRCADMINKPTVRGVLADNGVSQPPGALDDHPMAGFAVSMNFVPDDELGVHALDAWRSAEFPSTNAHVSALGMATFYNALAQEKLLSREHMELCRVSQGGFDSDVVLGPRVADHGWGLGFMLNQRGVAGPNRRTFGHGGSGGSFAFVDLEHRIGYAYVMNYFDATKCNADPRTVALSNEVYSALGVI
ncbi:beta-lactamase family protein [Mycobacterium sp. DSM 3803]|nr:beta-lactamase family protein [Mycobacterium sp. DSM 3803]OKH78388.1 esterase [Mycobacterium sp. SWH-M3]